MANRPNDGDAGQPGRAYDEWCQCFVMIDAFEDKLDGLRKWGLAFISGLLSAAALLGQVNRTTIAAYVKVAALGVAAILILVMRFLDRNYQLYQRAAGTRAAELETFLNFGLEKTIREEYVVHRMWQYVRLVYYGFEIAVLILGLAIAWGQIPSVYLAFPAPVFAILMMRWMETSVDKRNKPSRAANGATLAVRQ